MLPAIAVAVGVPLAFLIAVRRLDLYASRDKSPIFACFAFGFAAFAAAVVLNRAAAPFVGGLVLTVVVAPVIEELLKSTVLLYFVRRPHFTYFVDGAILGFAAGTAFAVVESVDYLRLHSDPLPFSINRAFTTSLMHGTTTGVVGVALGRFRFARAGRRMLALAGGLSAAIGLHMSFNALTTRSPTVELLYVFWAIGLTGVVLVVFLIRRGLREERGWLRESLTLAVGVSAGESRMVQELHRVDALLAPVELRFGVEKRRAVEELLRLQALIGLKHKAAALSADMGQQHRFEEEVATLQQRMARLRRQLGIYCMSYVRSVMPGEGDTIWSHLERVLVEPAQAQMNLWSVLGERAAETEPPPAQGAP